MKFTMHVHVVSVNSKSTEDKSMINIHVVLVS